MENEELKKMILRAFIHMRVIEGMVEGLNEELGELSRETREITKKVMEDTKEPQGGK